MDEIKSKLNDKRLVCFSEHLVAWMVTNEVPPKVLQKMKECYLQFEKDYQSLVKRNPDPIERAKLFQSGLDYIIKHELSTHKPSCKLGCSHCCDLTVAATNDEMKLIEQYVKENNLKVNQTPKKCLYLKDNSCQIYDIRPGACRKYFSVDDPIKCSDSNDNGTVLKPMLLESELCWSAVVTVVGSTHIHLLGR